jgi:hypothetical protein
VLDQDFPQPWDRSYRQVMATVEALTADDFASGSALEQSLGDTIDGALATNTYAHYVEHTPRVEALVASVKQGSVGSA